MPHAGRGGCRCRAPPHCRSPPRRVRTLLRCRSTPQLLSAFRDGRATSSCPGRPRWTLGRQCLVSGSPASAGRPRVGCRGNAGAAPLGSCHSVALLQFSTNRFCHFFSLAAPVLCSTWGSSTSPPSLAPHLGSGCRVAALCPSDRHAGALTHVLLFFLRGLSAIRLLQQPWMIAMYSLGVHLSCRSALTRGHSTSAVGRPPAASS